MDDIINQLPSIAMETPVSVRRVQPVRHELVRRELQVQRVESLGSEFVRVVLGGPELAGFVSLGFDDHIKLFFDAAAGEEPARRDYTPRHFDAAAQTLTIDFALHGDGVAASWARQAAAGQRLVIGGPRGSMVVPTDYDWFLLAGDATGAPAIARRLGELPEGSRCIVVVQLQDLAVLGPTAGASVQRVDSAAALVAALDALELPPGEGYVWAAGEAGAMAAVRDLMLQRKGHPREAMRIAAYWKRGSADFHHDDLVRPDPS